MNNGIKIHLLENKKFHMNIINILIRTELLKEDITVNGLLVKVLAKGSKKFPTIKEINNYLEQMYGASFFAEVIKKGEEQILSFSIEYLNTAYDNHEKALIFLEEIILNPLISENKFKESYTRIEKTNLRNHTKARRNDKDRYAKLKFIEKMFKDEPFALYGDGYECDVQGITSEQLFEQYTTLINTAKIEFIVSGNIADFEFRKNIIDRFQFQSNRVVLEIPKAKISKKSEKVIAVTENMGLEQSKIYLGFKTEIETVNDTKKHLEMLLINEIIGGNGNSKLFSIIREDQNLCYYAYSFLLRAKGVLVITAGVPTKKTDIAISSIEKLIGNLKNEDFSEENIINAKNNLINSFISISDNHAGYIDFFTSQIIFEDNRKIETIINEINSITKDEIIKTIKKIEIDYIYILS